MKDKIFDRIKMKFVFILFFMISFIANTFAAGESGFPPNYYDTVAVILLLIIVVTLLGIIYYEGKPKQIKVEKKESVLKKVSQVLTHSTPVEKEEEIMFEHSFDGIRELDSKIPPWFSWLFILTIIFAVYYMLDYHVFSTGKLMYDEYNEEVAIASAEKEALMKSGALINEETVTALTDAASLQSGKAIFDANCVACHANDGGGIVGPNLTDQYWINGGGIKNIFKTIKNGVPAKGMISWQTQLNPNQIQQVASYVLSLQGTTPSNPKEPQGEIWKGEK